MSVSLLLELPAVLIHQIWVFRTGHRSSVKVASVLNAISPVLFFLNGCRCNLCIQNILQLFKKKYLVGMVTHLKTTKHSSTTSETKVRKRTTN